MSLHVVLVHPEIPPNTGNVIRLTANTATALHLVEPLGFRMDDRELKRAGLDYHEYARVRVHRDFAACRAAIDGDRRRRWYAFTTAAGASLYEARFATGDVLVFGSETQGLPQSLLGSSPDRCLRIPMRPEARSLNLADRVSFTGSDAVGAQWGANHFLDRGDAGQADHYRQCAVCRRPWPA